MHFINCLTICSFPGDYLLGSDDQSIAWILGTHEIVFNDCVIKQVPMSSGPSGTTLPAKLTMILNMEEGTLMFKVRRTL